MPALALCCVNPFVFNRLYAGHLALLVGYALLPFAVISALRAPGRRGAAALAPALWWAILTALSPHYAWIYGVVVLIMTPAVRSPKALKKIARKSTEDGWPAHSVETLLADLGTICVNTIEPTDRSVPPFKKVALPTPFQRRAFDLLGVSYRLGYAA